MPPIAFRISGIDTTLTKERSTRRSRREETKVAVTSAHNNNKIVSESGESNISQIMDVERRIEIVHNFTNNLHATFGNGFNSFSGSPWDGCARSKHCCDPIVVQELVILLRDNTTAYDDDVFSS